jgi:hypothetical protein
MRLFAQAGHGTGDKVTNGLSENLIDGVIFRPKDLQRDTLTSRISDMRQYFPQADILLDPQFYLSLYADLPAVNIGNMSDWAHFKSFRRGELELTQNVDQVLEEFYNDISQLAVTSVIAPNIYISQSFDSREAVIAKNFIRQARRIFSKTSLTLPLYASLVVCREALQDRKEFEEFINDITLLDEPPDGFYLIVGSRSSDAKSDIYHADVVANWMLLNLSLSVNGYRVINGYSDIMTPFLGTAGGYAGATGWWSNLRMFSMESYFPSSGGRLPVMRYLSKLLLNRITFSEKEALSIFAPNVINNLPHDADYSPEPERTMEILQSWEALKSLNDELLADSQQTSLDNCLNAVKQAQDAYGKIAQYGIILDQKSRDEHLLALLEGLQQFKERAEL